MPSDYPDFPNARQMFQYLSDYADHYRLREYVQFHTKVIKIEPIDDGKQWQVYYTTSDNDGESEVKMKVYKGVIVCVGHHWNMRMPEYPEFGG